MLVLNKFTHDTRVLKESRTLVEAGYDVTVCALGNNKLPSCECIEGFTVKRWRSRVANWSWYPPGLMLLERSLALSKRLKQENAAIYHAHDADALLPTYWAARSSNTLLIYDSHEFQKGLSPRQATSRMRSAFHKLIEKIIVYRVQRVITVSNSLADALAETYHISKPLVVQNCPERSPEALNSNWLRENYDISETSPIVLYQGGLVKGRGLENLVLCAELLPKTTIVFVGSGPLDAQLHSLARELSNPKQIIFVGRVPLEQLPYITASADVGVVLTQNTCLNHYYSLPNKLFEYIQAEIPIVGSNLPEITRIINKYAVGSIVDPESPQSIKVGIEKLIENPQEYQEAQNNTKRAADIYSWQIESQKLLTLYAQLIKNRSE